MSRNLIDLTGMRFGRLLVLRRDGSVMLSSSQPTWLCRCDCGNEKVVTGVSIRNQGVRSCGCLHIEHARSLNVSHGMSGSPTHQSWRGMRERCLNPNNNHFKDYGGRGIACSEEWNSFEVFLSDMGERPEGKTLERKDINLGYSKSNCCWASPGEQARNTTRTKNITWNGRTQCRKDWAAELGITGHALAHRVKRFGLEVAMTMERRKDSRRKTACDEA